MSKEHRIHTVLDMLKLSPEEFDRFLPDLRTWYALGKDLESIDGEMTGMVWIDDGKPGEVHSVVATIKETDQTLIFPGTAYTERS